MGFWDRAGVQRHQGVSRGRSRRTRGQAGRVHEVAGKGRRLATRRKPPAANSIDPGHVGFQIEANFFAPNWSLDNTGLAAKNHIEIQAQEKQMFRGNVVSLHVARGAAVPMESTQEVKAITGRGLEGDRYFDGEDTGPKLRARAAK